MRLKRATSSHPRREALEDAKEEPIQGFCVLAVSTLRPATRTHHPTNMQSLEEAILPQSVTQSLWHIESMPLI
jgi:hypothetical protein